MTEAVISSISLKSNFSPSHLRSQYSLVVKGVDCGLRLPQFKF